MLRLTSVIVLAMLLGACTTIQSPSVDLISIENPYPPALTAKCEVYDRYMSSDIETIIITHTENAEKAINCYNKHNKLVEIIKERDL